MELLEGVGATVEVANDGVEAVRKMLEQPEPPNVDVVLMDLQMPEMDGYQATRKIRSDPRFASFPIIAMTAHATIEERQKCLEAGMNGHVSKPIDPSALFETLERFVSPTVKGRAVPPQEPAPAAVAEADALPEVAGLNTAEGLMRVAGNKKLYRKLLRQFSNTEADAAQRIASALAENDRALAERLAHTVKGVAGNIGAAAVQNAAANLEKAIAGSAPAAEIEVWRVALEECLAPLIHGLKTALEGADGEPAPAGDPEQVKVGRRAVVALPGRVRCRRDRLFRVGGASLADPFRRARVRTFCRPDRELCFLRSVRATDGGRGKEYLSQKSDRRVHLSPLARGTTGGVVQTSEDPLPQETRRSFLKASIPLEKGDKSRN